MRGKEYFIMTPHLVLLFNIVMTGCLDVRGYRKTQRFLEQDTTLDWTPRPSQKHLNTITEMSKNTAHTFGYIG